MLGLLGRDAGSLLGVEITSGFVKMLHLRRQAGRCRVAGWACEPLAAPAGGGEGAWIHALSQAHRQCATRLRQVAVALPASQVICKTCQMPRGACAQEIEGRLLDEAGQMFPFPLDDLALDFQVMQPLAEVPERVDVLVAACRQSQLDPLEQLFAQAGLELVVVELDSFALRRVLGPEPKPGVALVQLEAGEGVLHRWRADQLPLRYPLSLSGPGQWRDAAACLLQRFEGQVDEVVLAGGSADAGAAAMLSELLGIECRLVQLPAPLGAAGVPDASMALAYGLALGGLC